MRHALTESGWQKHDTDRALLPDGEAQTERVALRMAAAGITPDAVWASHALRAQQTAEIVSHTLCPNIDIEVVRPLYGDDEHEIANIIELCPDTIGSLLIVGHNPLVSRLVCRLSGSDGFGWFATSDAVWLEFGTDHWADIATAPITGKMKFSIMSK